MPRRLAQRVCFGRGAIMVSEGFGQKNAPNFGDVPGLRLLITEACHAEHGGLMRASNSGHDRVFAQPLVA